MSSRGPLGLGALCALALAAASCSGTQAAVADPSPTPVAVVSPSPSPSPTPPPVVAVAGERIVALVDVGDGALLGPDDRGEVDETGVTAFADAVFDWLDAHLTDLQAGGAGQLAEVAPEGLSTGDGAPTDAGTAALASPELPVATARYELTAYHDAAEEFASVRVTVTGPDAAERTATLVFAPDANGAPELVLVGPEVST